MSYAKQMLDLYPRDFNVDAALLASTLDDCAEACNACADDCLSETELLAELTKCIRLNLDCADVCTATSRVIARQTEYDANITRTLLDACVVACRSCGDECEHHADKLEHCRVCAKVCRRCEQACRDLQAAAPSGDRHNWTPRFDELVAQSSYGGPRLSHVCGYRELRESGMSVAGSLAVHLG